MEMQTRSATFQPASYNAERGTVEAVISAGADVSRRDYQGEYKERLNMTPSAWTTARGTVPVLKDHQRAVDSVIGRAENIRIDNGRALATIRLSDRPEVAGIRRDIETGILDSLSFGFTVPKWREFSEGGTRVREAEHVVVHEVSFVPIGADPQAKTRGEVNMEQQQQEQIRSIATAVGVVAPFADDLIQRGVSVDDARTAIIQEAVRNVPRIDNRASAAVPREAATDDFIRAAADALYCRINPAHTPEDGARQYVGLRLADIGRAALRARGLNTLGGDAEIVTRSLHTTSDFPNLLSNIANKVLAAAYQAAPSGMKTVCKRATVPDFKPRNVLRRGELPTLEKVNEQGEFKRGSLAEGKESYSIATFGKVFGMTRQTLINDDLGALADVSAGWGQAAMEFENQFLCDLLTSNSGGGPKLADNNNLFHAAHGNLAGAGAVISDATLSAARLALRSMKGLNGITPISATPKYLVVPAALETTAEKYLASIYPNAPSGVNPFSGALALVVDPRLDGKSATGWYVFADPAVLPVIEYAYLQGYEGVQVESRLGFDVDGVEIRARLDFGAGGVDSRGAFKNPGA